MKLNDYTYISHILPKGSAWECSQRADGTITLKKSPFVICFQPYETDNPNMRWLISSFDLYVAKRNGNHLPYFYRIDDSYADSYFGDDKRNAPILRNKTINGVFELLAQDLGPRFYFNEDRKYRIYLKSQARSKYPSAPKSVNLAPDLNDSNHNTQGEFNDTEVPRTTEQ